MIFKFMNPKKKPKRRVRIVRKYEPKEFVTKKDKEIFDSFMKAKSKTVDC